MRFPARWTTALHILVVSAACAVAGWLYWHHASHASRLVDGARWYWLDDDQMISMRYARNLAEGHGLVWNPGEYVEGYTNLLWTLIMAAIHALGAPDRLASLHLQVVSFAMMCLTLLQASRLLRLLVPAARLTIALPLLLILTCHDVVFWATNGFETILLTLLYLTYLVELLKTGLTPLGLGALALIPLTRGDGLHVWAGSAALGVWLAKDRWEAAKLLALSLIPTALHFAFRLAYYGDLLPNTYYMKAVGLPNKYRRGFIYARDFFIRYGAVIAFAVATASAQLSKHDRRGMALIATVAVTGVYALIIGGDTFPWGYRFFAHTLPVIMVFAAAGLLQVARALPARALWLGALIVTSVPLTHSWADQANPTPNGDPQLQVVVAAALRKNAAPDASVAVICAGIVPYFSRLKSLDVLGKTDRHIARLPYRGGSLTAHGKYDHAYTLGQKPDYVIAYRSDAAAHRARSLIPKKDPGRYYILQLLASTPFRRHYLDGPVTLPFLTRHTAVYVRDDSPERKKRRRWQPVTIAP